MMGRCSFPTPFSICIGASPCVRSPSAGQGPAVGVFGGVLLLLYDCCTGSGVAYAYAIPLGWAYPHPHAGRRIQRRAAPVSVHFVPRLQLLVFDLAVRIKGSTD
eukprot:2910054-Rhodomonas_salina.1